MAFPSSTPSAKVSDGRLVLTLPDAETPALWVMDLNDAQTCVIRLESDRNGFFVLKKHSGKGAAETVAVYRDRMSGTRALEAASKALEKARNTRPLTGPNGQPVIIRKASLGGRIFLYFVAFWFLMWMMGLDRLILRAVVAPFYPAQTSAAEQQQLEQLQRQMSQTPATPQAQGQPQEPAAGVPLSADAFLKEHQSAPPAQ